MFFMGKKRLKLTAVPSLGQARTKNHLKRNTPVQFLHKLHFKSIGTCTEKYIFKGKSLWVFILFPEIMLVHNRFEWRRFVWGLFYLEWTQCFSQVY